jgi:hypothetical protein
VKLLLENSTRRNSGAWPDGSNEFLRLVGELYRENGSLPVVDIDKAQVTHWNGHNLSVAGSEIREALDRGLIDENGDWTAIGRSLIQSAPSHDEEAAR